MRLRREKVCSACGQYGGTLFVHQGMHLLSPGFPQGKIPVVERPLLLENANVFRSVSY